MPRVHQDFHRKTKGLCNPNRFGIPTRAKPLPAKDFACPARTPGPAARGGLRHAGPDEMTHPEFRKTAAVAMPI